MQLVESFAGHWSQAKVVSSFGILLELLWLSRLFCLVSAAVGVGSQSGLKLPFACVSELQDRTTVRAGSSRTKALRQWGWSPCFPERVRSLLRLFQLLSCCWYQEHSHASIKGSVRKHHKRNSLWKMVGPSCWVLLLHNTLGWKHVKGLLLLSLLLLRQLLLSEQAVFKLPVLCQRHEKYFWVHCLIKVTRVNLF